MLLFTDRRCGRFARPKFCKFTQRFCPSPRPLSLPRGTLSSLLRTVIQISEDSHHLGFPSLWKQIWNVEKSWKEKKNFNETQSYLVVRSEWTRLRCVARSRQYDLTENKHQGVGTQTQNFLQWTFTRWFLFGKTWEKLYFIWEDAGQSYGFSVCWYEVFFKVTLKRLATFFCSMPAPSCGT